MMVKSGNPEVVRAGNLQREKASRIGGNLKPSLSKFRKPIASTQQKALRKPGVSGSNQIPGSVLINRDQPLPKERIVSEYQGNFKPWPLLPVRRQKPMDCIRLSGNLDLVTNYADVYKGLKGEVAKLFQHPITLGSDEVPFGGFTEYQDNFRAWSTRPARLLKPQDYKIPGSIDFVTKYSQEYKAWDINKRLPIIQLDQVPLRQGPFQKTTTYRCEFAPKVAEPPPRPCLPKGGDELLLNKKPQLPRSISVKEGGKRCLPRMTGYRHNVKEP